MDVVMSIVDVVWMWYGCGVDVVMSIDILFALWMSECSMDVVWMWCGCGYEYCVRSVNVSIVDVVSGRGAKGDRGLMSRRRVVHDYRIYCFGVMCPTGQLGILLRIFTKRLMPYDL